MVECGIPSPIPYTTRIYTDVKYKENATYTCDEGYTFNATDPFYTSLTIQCKANGLWDTTYLPSQCDRKYD